MRLFVAIHPDPATQAWLGEAQARLRKALGRGERELRWIDPALIHVTLVFLGELPDPAPVVKLLETCPFPPMELTVGGLGVFPDARRPSVLWVGLEEPSGALAGLQAGVSQALSALVEPERRRFEPHLTLARIRPGARWHANLEKLSAAIGAAPLPWRVGHFALMQSHLEKGGARHTVVRKFLGS